MIGPSAGGMSVQVRSGDQAFNRLDELQQFDTVVLANVPRRTAHRCPDSDARPQHGSLAAGW